MQKRLTAAVIEKLKPDPTKRIEIIDLSDAWTKTAHYSSRQKILVADVQGRGSSRRREIGKNNRITIGPFPLISLADARQKADKFREQAERGIDPKSVKKAQIQARVSSRTEALIDQFIAHKSETTKNWKNTKALLDATEPQVGSLPNDLVLARQNMSKVNFKVKNLPLSCLHFGRCRLIICLNSKSEGSSISGSSI